MFAIEDTNLISGTSKPMIDSKSGIFSLFGGGGSGGASGGLLGGSGGLTGVIAGASPTMGIISSITGALNIGENLDLVKKYGLNSWGASSSPEQAQQTFAEDIVPYITGLVEGMNDENIEKNLNEIEKFITFVIAIQQHKLRDHTRANSTREGRVWVIKTARQLYVDTVEKLVSQLKASGYRVTSKETFSGDADHSYTYISPNGFHGDKGWSHKLYTVEKANVIESTVNATVNGTRKLLGFNPLLIFVLVSAFIGMMFKKGGSNKPKYSKKSGYKSKNNKSWKW